MRRATLGIIAFGMCLALPGLARAQQATSLDRCISAVTGDVLRYVDKAGACVRKCEDAKRKGQLAQDTRCRRPSNHPQTQSCILAALELLAGSKSNALKRCTDDEVALFYGGSNTCPGKNQTVPDLLTCLAKKAEKAVDGLTKRIYHPNRPPVCGDGTLSPNETCEPNAYPNGCPSYNAVCHPDYCYCTFYGCGNGILEGGEDCDYSAYPVGCGYNEYCDGGCSCRRYGSASSAFLCESPDLIE